MGWYSETPEIGAKEKKENITKQKLNQVLDTLTLRDFRLRKKVLKKFIICIFFLCLLSWFQLPIANDHDLLQCEQRNCEENRTCACLSHAHGYYQRGEFEHKVSLNGKAAAPYKACQADSLVSVPLQTEEIALSPDTNKVCVHF